MAFRNITLNVGLMLIVIIILLTAKFTKNDTELNYNISNGTHFTPLHYDVELKFDVYKNVFFGECNIVIQINYPTKNITIKNSGIFGITEIDLIDNNDNQAIPRKYPITVNIEKFSSINKTNIYLDFTQLSDFLCPGTYILRMIYVRTILDNINFFESYYTDKEILDNKKYKVIRAEELLPCWDDPEFKSTFNISIYHHRNYVFLSNMRIRKTIENMSNMLWTYFDESPLMSAQHLTFVIINNVTSHTNIDSTANVEYVFWCRKEIINHMQFAEHIAQKVVDYLEQKSTKIFPKIHYIAIRGFQHSNVKILGFILLREEDIIYNETLDHISRKMEVANLIAYHTISHWYDDVILWSKEGFITFLAAYILDQSSAYYRMIDLFVVQTQQESLRFDTLPDTDSLSLHTANISTVYSFRSSFHCIKSSIIWRMLHHLVSDDVFWISINIHIERRYNQSNALQIDELWEIMQKSWNNSGHPHELLIKDIINTWITQKHYSLFVERNYLDNKTAFWNINSKFDKDTKYSTLVTYMTKSKNYDYFWFDRQKSYWSFDETFDKHDWIIVNVHQIGYYRVRYNYENWKYLVRQLHENLTDIHVLNRAQIIDDAFEFYKLSLQRQLNFTMFWNITSFLFKDVDYVAWYPMIKAVEYMTCIWAIQDTVVLKLKINEMFYRLLQNIGYQEDIYENDFTKYLREEAVKWACVLGEPECRLVARSQLEKDLQNSVQDTPLKWKEWIYCKGLMTAYDIYWVKVYEKWEETGNNMLLEYLTCSTNPRTNRYYLRKTMGNEFFIRVLNNNMRANIVLLILAKHAKNDIVFEFMLQQLKFVKLSSKKQVDQIAIIIVIVTHDTSIDHFEKISKFVENNLTISDTQLVDAIEQKIKKRRKEYQKQVENYEFLSLIYNHNVQ